MYFFDRGQAEEYQRQGINAGYLPLAADVETFYPVAVTEVDKKEYGAEISLVGKLYQTVYPQYMAPLKEYDRGYLEGVIAAQKKVYGGYFLPDFITDELIQNMNAVYQKQWNGEITVNHREIEFLLASEITRRERQEILTLLSNHFDVALYSGEQDVAIPKIRKKNYIDYYTQMPKAFKCSKVNLNISLKTIRTGIPLRILDILASGGFVISNFQEELAEYFRLGEEIITYYNKSSKHADLGVYDVNKMFVQPLSFEREETDEVTAYKTDKKTRRYAPPPALLPHLACGLQARGEKADRRKKSAPRFKQQNASGQPVLHEARA